MNAKRVNFLKGWNAALAVVGQALRELANDTLPPEAHAMRQTVLEFVDEQRKDGELENLLHPPLSNEQLAEKYACSLRTVTGWRSRGCPLHKSQWKILDWLHKQHHIPKRTAAKFAKQFALRDTYRNSESPNRPNKLALIRCHSENLLRQMKQMDSTLPGSRLNATANN
jgi:hypothetical protein